MFKSRNLLLNCAFGALITAASLPSFAIAQQTTAGLRGEITNSAGQAVKNASVLVVHVPTGTKSITKTNSQGYFDLTGLNVGGPYSVKITADGYNESINEDLSLGLGEAHVLNIALESVGEKVVVTGKRASNLSNPGSRTSMGRTAISNVVTVKRDIRELARRDALTQLDANTRGTGPSGGLYIAGSAPRANRITIDGVRSNDDFGLNTGGLSTNLGPISLEAVEQMSVQAVPADVQEGDFTGGSMSMVLRSGTNKIHGSIFTYIRKDNLYGRAIYNPAADTFTYVHPYVPDKNWGAFLSGPIIKDTLFISTSYEKYTSSSLVAAGPSGAGFGISFLNGGLPFTQADIDAVIAPWSGYSASSKLNPGTFRANTPFEDEKYSAKLDWNIMTGQKASFTYRHAFSSVWKSTPASSSNINFDTSWYSQPENEDNYALQLNSKWTDNFSTQARIISRNYQRGQTPPEGQGFANISICTDAVNAGTVNSCTSGNNYVGFGPDQFRQANVLKTTNDGGEIVGNYRLGSHSIKGGYQNKNIGIYNLFVQAANGVYTFDSKKSFADGMVDQLFFNNNPTGDQAATAANFSYTNHTLFLQDTFDVNANLNVNYGLRYDFWDQSDKPALNASFKARNGFSNQTTYDGIKVLQPRIGAKWHSTSGEFDSSGSFGLYTGGLPDVFISNRFGNTGVLTNSFTLQRLADGSFKEIVSGKTFLATDATAIALMNNRKTDANFAVGSPSVATALLSLEPTLLRLGSTNSMAPNFKMPSDWKLNYSGHWNTKMGPVLGLDAVFVRSNVGLAFKDLRARPLTVNGVQQLTPDGRIRYDGLVLTGTGATLDAINQAIYAKRVLAGLDVGKNADGSAMYDLANPGSGFDIQAYNPDTDSTSTTLALSIAQKFRDFKLLRAHDSLDLYAAYTYQTTNQFGGIPEFATTDCCGGSNYGDQFSLLDPNAPTKGRSTYEVRNSFKVNATYETEIFKNAKTSFTLFGDMHNGRTLNFYMGDAGSATRGQVFGVVSNNQLAFIPQTATASGSDPLLFVTNGVTTKFASATELARFQAIVNKFGLQPGIVTKGMKRNPDVKRFDLHVSQELPMPWFDGHKVSATLDIFNVGNLLNRKWGVVGEYGSDGRQGAPMFKVACADATGNAVAADSPICASYRISNVSTTFNNLTVNQSATLYSVMIGLKYSF